MFFFTKQLFLVKIDFSEAGKEVYNRSLPEPIKRYLALSYMTFAWDSRCKYGKATNDFACQGWALLMKRLTFIGGNKIGKRQFA